MDGSQRTRDLSQLVALSMRQARNDHRRIATSVHDDLQQLLVAIRLSIGTCLTATDDDHVNRASLERAHEYVNGAIDATRHLIADLAPPVVYESGLVAALDWLPHWLERHGSLKLNVEFGSRRQPRGEQLSVVLFFAIRDLLQLAARDGIRRASVDYRVRDGALEVTVFIGADRVTSDRNWNALRGGAPEGLTSIMLNLRECLAPSNGSVDVPSGYPCPRIFRVRLPETLLTESGHDLTTTRRGESPPVARAAARADEEPSMIRVVIADDHEKLRAGLVRFLEAQPDMRVVGVASDGREAIARALHVKPDVVVMDLSMPVLNGIEATRRICARMGSVRVVALSTREDPASIDAVVAAGASAFVSKAGLPSPDLPAAIRRVARA